MNIRELKEFLSRIIPGEYEKDYIIAGGYARDTFFKVEPKDADVFMEFGDGKILVEVMAKLNEQKVPYDSYGCEYGNSSIDDRMECVIKLPFYNIDLLFAKNPLMKAVDLLDYNVNQCYIGKNDEVVYPHGFSGELELMVPDITQQRQEYMQAKWEALRVKI